MKDTMHINKLKIIDSKYYTITNRLQLDITPIDEAQNISKLFNILNNNVFMTDNKYVVLEGNPQITNYRELERKNYPNSKLNAISKSSAKETDTISLLWDKQYQVSYWDKWYSPEKDTRADEIKLQTLNKSEWEVQIKRELKKQSILAEDCKVDNRYVKLTKYGNIACGYLCFALASHKFSKTIQQKLLQWSLLKINEELFAQYAYTIVVNIADGLDLVLCLIGDTNNPIKISIDKMLNYLQITKFLDFYIDIQSKKNINYDIWLNVDSNLTPSNKNFWQNVIDLDGNQRNDLFKQFMFESKSKSDIEIELITPEYVINHAMKSKDKHDLIKNYPKIIKYLEQFV